MTDKIFRPNCALGKQIEEKKPICFGKGGGLCSANCLSEALLDLKSQFDIA